MAVFGDRRYVWYGNGFNATNSSAVEGFFGAYSGLSLLHTDEAVYLQITASVNEFFFGPPSASISPTVGYKIFPSLSTVEIPPMRAGVASLLQVNRIQGNAASAFNASYNWVVWKMD